MSDSVKVLYCGMANDVMAPLLLVPDLDVLWAIDLVDPAYSDDGTWDGVKREVLRILVSGDDRGSRIRKCYASHERRWNVHRLPQAASVVEDEDDERCWRMRFSYGGKDRIMEYWHHRDFCKPWPREIKGVGHVMAMGASFPCFGLNDVKEPGDDLTLERMMRERTIGGFLIYVMAYNNCQRQARIVTIRNGRQRLGTDVAVIKEDNLFGQRRQS